MTGDIGGRGRRGYGASPEGAWLNSTTMRAKPPLDVDNMTSACDTLMEHHSDPCTYSFIIKTQKINLVLIDLVQGCLLRRYDSVTTSRHDGS